MAGDLVADVGGPVGEPFDEDGTAGDFDSVIHGGGIEFAFFAARSAGDELASGGEEVGDEFVERLEGSAFVDLGGFVFHGSVNTIGAEEDHGVFTGAEGGGGDDEADGAFVGIVFGGVDGDAEGIGHGIFRGLVFFDEVEGMLGFEEGVFDDTAPGRDSIGSAGIESPHPDDGVGGEIGKMKAQVEEQFSATGIAAIEFTVMNVHHFLFVGKPRKRRGNCKGNFEGRSKTAGIQIPCSF